MTPAEQKQAARERAWAALQEAGAARFPRPIHGRIPNFAGSEDAARALLATPEFQRARVVKVNPDAPQRPDRIFWDLLPDEKRDAIPLLRERAPP